MFRAQNGICSPEKNRDGWQGFSDNFNAPEDAGIPIGHGGSHKDQIRAGNSPDPCQEFLFVQTEVPVPPGDVSVGFGFRYLLFLRGPSSEGLRVMTGLVDAIHKEDFISDITKSAENVQKPKRLGPQVEEGKIMNWRIYSQYFFALQ